VETYVEFRSDRFPPSEIEAQFMKPDRHGQRLAEFLTASLRAKGIAACEPIGRGWGWVVAIRTGRDDRFRLWIGCRNDERRDDGYVCFIEPHTPTVRKWFREVDTTERVGALRTALDQLLAEAGVRDKRWWTHETFNGGPG
jgi:hypothetical protein